MPGGGGLAGGGPAWAILSLAVGAASTGDNATAPSDSMAKAAMSHLRIHPSFVFDPPSTSSEPAGSARVAVWSRAELVCPDGDALRNCRAATSPRRRCPITGNGGFRLGH